MQNLVSIYCEGHEVKAVLLTKEKDELKLQRVVSVSMEEARTPAREEMQPAGDVDLNDFSDDLSLDSLEENSGGKDESTGIEYLSEYLSDFNLAKTGFIPVLTEPVVNYHIFEAGKEIPRNKLKSALIDDIKDTKGIVVSPDSIDSLKLDEATYLGVFVEDEIPCVNMINALAAFNKRRFYKIPAIKSAEASLAYLVGKTRKFREEDYTLIIYAGKEYSKFIFLSGNGLKHIGSTIDLGTKNLTTYDVYFSKILLEMENGEIPRLDNVLITSDDDPEDLILSFYSAFPEAEVSQLELEGFDTSELDEDSIGKTSSFAIPIAAAIEYIDEMNKEYEGINILPKYIRENQKIMQFGWHSYVLLPIIFFAAYFITSTIMKNYQESVELDLEIERLTLIQERNRELLEEMSTLTQTVNNFDQTQSILDEASKGTEIYSKAIDRVSGFIELRRNFWLKSLRTDQKSELMLTGYSLSRSTLTDFAEYNNSSMLKNMIFEPLRERNVYSYSINLKLTEQTPENHGS